MRQHLTEMDTIGTIRQSIRHPIGKNYIWVLVEGTTDLSLYRKLLDGENCQVEIIHGGGDSENSGSGIKKLRYTMSEFESCDRVIGIRDADFLHIEQKQETIRNLFLTDAHDAEMMLLACDAVFKNILIENLPNEFNDFILLRNKLLESLTFLGGIRWINHVENLTLKLKDIGLADFYDAINFCINKEKCIESVHKRSHNKRREININEVDDKIKTIEDYFNLCNGHDIVKGLALYITAMKNKGIKDDHIASQLRIAYRKEDFATTKLFECLKNWERQTGYTLFRVD